MKIINLFLIFSLICFTVNAQDYTSKIIVQKGQNIEVISKITQSMDMGMQMNTTTTITTNFQIVDVSESEFTVKSMITKMKSSADVMGTNVDYDSEKPDSENNPQMVESLKEKLNVEKEFLINRTTLAGKSLTKSDSKEEDPMEALMNVTGNDESATAIEMLFLIPKGKKAGDSWTTNNSANGNKLENNYTLKEVKNGVATVDFKILYTIDQTIPMNGTDVLFNIKITSTGNLTVSTETGLVKKKTTSTLSEGTMSAMDQTTPITMNTEVESTFNIK